MKFKAYEKLKQNSTHILMVNCMETRSGLGEFAAIIFISTYKLTMKNWELKEPRIVER